MFTRRKPEIDIKTRGVSILWDKFTSELRMLCKRCPAYSGRDCVLGFLVGTAGTSRHDVKGEIQIARTMSMRVPMHGTGAELFVVVLKHL